MVRRYQTTSFGNGTLSVEAETLKQLEPESRQAKYQDSASASTLGYGPQRASCHFKIASFPFQPLITAAGRSNPSSMPRTEIAQTAEKGTRCLPRSFLCAPTSSWPLLPLRCHEHYTTNLRWSLSQRRTRTLLCCFGFVCYVVSRRGVGFYKYNLGRETHGSEVSLLCPDSVLLLLKYLIPESQD